MLGIVYKETGCYFEYVIYGNESFNRMSCFPFIEPHEPFIFGDGTVYYAQRFRVAAYLKRENPHLKVLFLLRDPIERGRQLMMTKMIVMLVLSTYFLE